MKPSTASLLLVLLLSISSLPAQDPVSPEAKRGAALLKTDILGIFAHPDDETGVATTFAWYAWHEHAAVTAIYCTRGEGGGNMVGIQSGPSLGILRETELRNCLATLGVRDCYFLDQLDWAYTESSLATLNKWDREETLRRLVRLIRSLRPEVIVTMNPAPRPGQHGHHQAAGILATEAFIAAADPERFPEQLHKEGISPWQTRKLYYGGNGLGTVATVETTAPLTDGRTIAQITGAAMSHHRSQAFGNSGDSPWLQRPRSYTLVRSVLPFPETETNLLQGLDGALIPPTSPTPSLSASPSAPPPLALSLRFIPRPAITRFNDWARAQGIEQVTGTFPADLPLVAGQPNPVELELSNSGSSPLTGQLLLSHPPDWSVTPTTQTYRLAPGQTQRVTSTVTPPLNSSTDGELKASIDLSGTPIEATANAHPVPLLRVPRLSSPPSLDGSGHGWEPLQPVQITPEHRFQGRISGPADSGASFRLGHHNRTLYVDVQVNDDRVVRNIAPNDIKGHWRSDSIEICVDPTGTAEDTMGCFKAGIFPFDTTGTVRAARDADANQGPIEETAPATRLHSSSTPQGYRIQAAIPFQELGINDSTTKRLGFNLIIYDGDKADAAMGENINKSRIAWAPRSGVMGRPEDWGRIELIE